MTLMGNFVRGTDTIQSYLNIFKDSGVPCELPSFPQALRVQLGAYRS